jgi:hypothetical protein
MNPGTFFPEIWAAGLLYKGAVLRLNRAKVGVETNANAGRNNQCHP